MAQANRLRGQSPQPRRSTHWVRTTPPGVARRGRQRYRVVASGLDAVNGPNQQHHHATDLEIVANQKMFPKAADFVVCRRYRVGVTGYMTGGKEY